MLLPRQYEKRCEGTSQMKLIYTEIKKFVTQRDRTNSLHLYTFKLYGESVRGRASLTRVAT